MGGSGCFFTWAHVCEKLSILEFSPFNLMDNKKGRMSAGRTGPLLGPRIGQAAQPPAHKPAQLPTARDKGYPYPCGSERSPERSARECAWQWWRWRRPTELQTLRARGPNVSDCNFSSLPTYLGEVPLTWDTRFSPLRSTLSALLNLDPVEAGLPFGGGSAACLAAPVPHLCGAVLLPMLLSVSAMAW